MRKRLSSSRVSSKMQGYRSSILHFLGDPAESGSPSAWQYLEDGVLIVENSRIKAVLPAKELKTRFPKSVRILHYPNHLILPGFVDCHIHFPQIDMAASYGEQLLEWLNRYVFPAEERFKDKIHARAVAKIFLRELLRNGTTTALVFATVHPQSAEALFEEAAKLDMRLITGKVWMDQNAPAELLDNASSARADSRRLIETWHGRGRLLYAITPRFAPTSSGAQLEAAGRLRAEHPGVYLHTHLAESAKEVDWVRRIFPGSKSYLEIYDRFHLLGERSVFAHAIHLSDGERARLAETSSSVAFCPTSNLFLGSGLFDLEKTISKNIRIGIGTDIGAGTSFSILQNLNEAYKIAQLQSQKLSPLKAYYLATLGGAKALGLEDKIGNFEPGKEADFIVVDPNATPFLAYRMKQVQTLQEKLFLLMMLGDDRAIRETYITGKLAHFSTPSSLRDSPREVRSKRAAARAK